jgi:hypothetical protein
MLLFGTAGLSLSLLAFVIGVIALYFRFVLNKGYRPVAYLVILLFLSGLLLFAIGFIAELLATVLHRIESIDIHLKRKNSK